MSLVFDRSDIESTIPERFDRIAARFPSHLAIRDQEHSWTYQEFQRRANQLAQAVLERSSVGTGCVAYLVPHSPDMVLCGLAILKAGKTSLCIHPSLPAAAQRDILSDAAPDLLITCRAFAELAREISEDRCGLFILEDRDDQAAELPANVPVQAGDAALIFYTSGSTGRPKGVVKSHRVVLHRAWLCVQYDHIQPADRHSLFTYCSFATTESDVYGTLLNGATLCLFDLATRGLDELAGWIEAEQVTILHPPVMFFRRFLSTLKSENLFPAVRLVALAGETVVAADLECWRWHFSNSCALRHRFSSTETGNLAVACIEPGDLLTPGIVPPGKAVVDKYLKVVDEAGDEVGPGVEGELLVQSEYLASGYWRRPEETALAFAVDPQNPKRRTFRTGDLGRLEADGGFKFLGRRDHQVKIRGYRVELKEVESALLMLDAVQEAAVIVHRIQDETRLIAYVVNKADYLFSAVELRDELRKKLPEWKVPTRFISLPSMPLTPTGKIDRQSLPPVDFSSGLDSGYVEPRNPIEQQLASIWSEVLGIERIGIQDNFFALGGHSLLAVRLFAYIEKSFGRRLPLAVLFRHGTIAHLAQLLAESPCKTDRATVLSLQTGGDGRPLFLMPTMGGGPLVSRALFELLEGRFPIYGLQIALDRQNLDEARDFRATAGSLVTALRQFQPHGPYTIAGFSFGGMMAFEVACQLTDLGEKVDLLAVIDVGPSRRGRKRQWSDRWRQAIRIGANVPSWIREEIRTFSTKQFLLRTSRKLQQFYRQLASRGGAKMHVDEMFDSDRIPLQNRELAQALYEGFRGYTPRPYPGKLTLIRALTGPLLRGREPDLGWSRFVRDVDLRAIPGNHETIFQPPHVSELARQLAEAMQGRDC